MENKMNKLNAVFKDFKEFYETLKMTGVKNALDVGCYDNYLQDKLKELNIMWMGIDTNPTPKVVLKGAMENLPINDSILDLVISIHSFEHTVDPIKTLQEFNRVLKPAGILYLVVPYPCDIQHFSMDKTHNFVFSESQLLNLLMKTKFNVMGTKLLKITEHEKDWNIIITAGAI